MANITTAYNKLIMLSHKNCIDYFNVWLRNISRKKRKKKKKGYYGNPERKDTIVFK